MLVWVTLRSRRAWPCHMSGMIRSPWGCWGAVVATGDGGGASRRSPPRRALGVVHRLVGGVLVPAAHGDGAFGGLGALVGVELLRGDGHGFPFGWGQVRWQMAQGCWTCSALPVSPWMRV